MIHFAFLSLLLTGFLTFFFEVAQGPIFGTSKRKKKGKPAPSAVFGLLAGLGGMAVIAPSVKIVKLIDDPRSLYWLVLGGVLLFVLTLKSDLAIARSKRHFFATLFAAVFLYLGGFQITYAWIPFMGSVAFSTLGSVILSLVWIVLVVSLVELCSLMPMLTGFVAIVLGLFIFLPMQVYSTYTGLVLGGALVGVVIGRFAGGLCRGELRAPEKTENLMIGYTIAATTLTLYLKSLALTGLVVPLSALTIFVVIMVLQGFDNSMMLRSRPRE
jgi:hypothetical protein